MAFEIHPIHPTRPVDCARPRASAHARENAAPQSAVALGENFSPGPEPFDHERVETIRKALESGTYPVVPAKIADALIAARFVLKLPR